MEGFSFRCKHYFCEKCALERFKKTTRCFVCNTPITTFNPANNLIAKLKNMDNENEAKKSDSDSSD